MTRTEILRHHQSLRDDGFAGLEPSLFIASTLTLVALLLVPAAATAIVKTKVDRAASAAARAYVEAPSEDQASTDAYAAARAQAGEQIYIRVVSGNFERCSRVTIEVVRDVSSWNLPLLKLAGVDQIRSRQTETVDPYRDGVPGVANC